MCCSEEGCCGGGCKYQGKCITNLGWTLTVCGVIGFILGVVADIVYAGYPFAVVHHISAPIWGGVFIVVIGGLAICGGRNPDNACKRITLLVLSIFGIIFALCIWILGAIGLGADGTQCDDFVKGPCLSDEDRYNYSWDRPCSWWYNYWYDLYPDWRSVNCGGIKALHALQLVLGLTEMVAMFILSIRSCCGTCCKGTSQQPQTHVIVYQPGQAVQQQYHPGVVIMQPAVPGAPAQQYTGQPAYNPQVPVQPYTSPQPGPYAPQPQPGPYPAQPGPYPTQPGPYPSQPGPYPTQPVPYPTQPGPYPTQSGPSPHMEAPPTPSDPPPYDLNEFKKQ